VRDGTWKVVTTTSTQNSKSTSITAINCKDLYPGDGCVDQVFNARCASATSAEDDARSLRAGRRGARGRKMQNGAVVGRFFATHVEHCQVGAMLHGVVAGCPTLTAQSVHIVRRGGGQPALAEDRRQIVCLAASSTISNKSDLTATLLLRTRPTSSESVRAVCLCQTRA
jgi:hypothetical protein